MPPKSYDATHEKIVHSAKEQFLKFGYEGANLRDICKCAGITTGAFYRHFKDKDALFSSLVEPAAEHFIRVNAEGNHRGFDALKNGYERDVLLDTKKTSHAMVELIYANKDAFTLLINCAHGSTHENFIEQIIEIEEVETMHFLEQMCAKGYPCMPLTKKQLHTIMSAQCYALFEVVRHDLEKEEALVQVGVLIDFFNEGWKKIFGI